MSHLELRQIWQCVVIVMSSRHIIPPNNIVKFDIDGGLENIFTIMYKVFIPL